MQSVSLLIAGVVIGIVMLIAGKRAWAALKAYRATHLSLHARVEALEALAQAYPARIGGILRTKFDLPDKMLKYEPSGLANSSSVTTMSEFMGVGGGAGVSADSSIAAHAGVQPIPGVTINPMIAVAPVTDGNVYNPSR